jgi:FkbM family methyltransferase
MKNIIKKILPYGLRRKIKRYVLLRQELELQGVLDELDPDAKIIFDIGANVGNVSITLIETFQGAIIYSFEPGHITFELLKQNLSAWCEKGRSKLFKLGFYDEAREGRLNITNFNGANSMLDLTQEYKTMNPEIRPQGSESIDLIRLDDFVKENNIKHIDLVKIDVEGVEKQVLLGGREAFTNIVDAVLMEISFVRTPRRSGEYIELFKLMHEYGFAPAKIYDLAHSTGSKGWRLAQFDCVFKKII